MGIILTKIILLGGGLASTAAGVYYGYPHIAKLFKASDSEDTNVGDVKVTSPGNTQEGKANPVGEDNGDAGKRAPEKNSSDSSVPSTPPTNPAGAGNGVTQTPAKK